MYNDIKVSTKFSQSALEQTTSFFGYLYRFFTPFLSFPKFYLHFWHTVSLVGLIS